MSTREQFEQIVEALRASGLPAGELEEHMGALSVALGPDASLTLTQHADGARFTLDIRTKAAWNQFAWVAKP